MPDVVATMCGFSFKRAHESWGFPASAHLEPGEPIVLTGINAGGKTLALRAIEAFTELIADPTPKGQIEFEAMTWDAGIEEISVTYMIDSREQVYELFPTWELSEDADIFNSAASIRWPDTNDDGGPGGEIEGHPELEDFPKFRVFVETSYRRERNSSNRLVEALWEQDAKEGGNNTSNTRFSRRYGYEIEGIAFVRVAPLEFPRYDEEFHYDFPRSFGKWSPCFGSADERGTASLESDRIFIMGMTDELQALIERETGIVFDHAFDGHEWWDPAKAFHHKVRTAEVVSVEDAYDLDLVDSLRLTRVGRRLPPFEGPSHDGVWRTSDHTKKLEAIAGMNEILEEAYESAKRKFLIDPDTANNRPKPRSADSHPPEVFLNRFTYPRRNPLDGSDWLGTLEPPKIDMENYQNPGKGDNLAFFAERSRPKSWDTDPGPFFHQGSLDELLHEAIYRFPHLIKDYAPDLFFFIICREFLGDFTANAASDDDKSVAYFSSGQKRLAHLMSTLLSLPDGTTVLLDEPELSLHIDWQRKLIDQLKLFSHLPFILATHSPDIIYHHTDAVVEVPPRGDL